MDKDYFKRNVPLYLANDQDLYNQALEVNDYVIDNNQISNLYSATIRAIMRDSTTGFTLGKLPTYHEAITLKIIVAETAHQLQEEAKS